MALVGIETEKYIQKQTRLVVESKTPGSSEIVAKQFTRTKTTTITTWRGDRNAVQGKLDLARDDSRTMRKIDGPWWEANVSKVEETPWVETGSSDTPANQ